MQFKPAKAIDRKLKLLLTGPTGSGKTLSALEIAFGLSEKVGVIDSEYGRASDYQGYIGIGDYFTLNLDMYSPLQYGRALDTTIQSGFEVVIIDSLSQEWSGEGGTLDIVNKAANQPGKNSYTAWGVGKPLHNQLITKIIAAPVHVICTCRSKMDYEIVKDDKGKTQVNRIGLKAVQSDDIEYEFMIVGEMNMDHELHIAITHGTNLQPYEDETYVPPFIELGQDLKRSLSNVD